MSRLQIVFASALAGAVLVVAGPATARQKDSSKAASGGVKISVHTHSNNNPDFPGLMFSTDRLPYDFAPGDDFSYSSRTCELPAPFVDIGLDFRPNYPGVDDATGTAAVRYRSQGTVTKVNGDKGTIEGTLTAVLCVNENGVQTRSDNQIVIEYRAKHRRVSDNEVQLTGKFAISPTRSTGTFEDLTGRGSIKAILTCLRATPTCAERGHFTDFVGLRGDTSKGVGETVPGLVGSFRDPTITTG